MTENNQLDDTSPLVEVRSAAVDKVDFSQRIITVLAVPYEQHTPVLYKREVWNEIFTRSAFNGIETRQRRIPAIAVLEYPPQEHKGRLVGRITDAYPDSKAGLVADIKISRTPLGDETLELANDESLFASVGYMVKNEYGDQVLDRRNKERRINRAFLDHLGLVSEPAYKGAKVLSVRSDTDIEETSPSQTPNLDNFYEDPIFQWAAERAKRLLD